MLSSTNKNPDLKAYLKLIDEKRKSDGKLIYKKKSVPVSKIIQQLYCEKQLELELIHGERLNLEKKRGKEGHEADLEFLSPVKIEKAWNEATRQNKRKPYKIREFHLLAKYQGFIIEGKADEVSFLRGKVLTLSEFKFRKNKKLFNTDKIQGFLYGFLLNIMGFDTSNLIIKTVCFDSADRKYALLLKDAPDNMLDYNYRSYKLNLDESRKELDKALNFWKGEREAIATKNPKKCKKCQFIDKCSSSNFG